MGEQEKTREEQEAELAEAIANLEEDPKVDFHDDGTTTLELSRPIPLKTGSITQLVFKDELTAGDLEDSEKGGSGEIGRANRLIAAACDTAYIHIRKLRSDDMQKAGTIVARLSGKDQETGGK